MAVNTNGGRAASCPAAPTPVTAGTPQPCSLTTLEAMRRSAAAKNLNQSDRSRSLAAVALGLRKTSTRRVRVRGRQPGA